MELFKLSASNSNFWVHAFHDLNTIIEKKECSCGRMHICYHEDTSNPFTLVIETHARYPDFLKCYGVGLSIFTCAVSEKVVEAFSETGITGYSATPILIVREQDGKLKEIDDAPQYYKLNICGNIDLDYEKMHLKRKHVCKECGQYTFSRQKLGISYLDLSSWSGHDLCRLNTFPAIIICSEKVIATIKKYKLKGASMLESRYLFEPQYSKNITKTSKI